MIMEVAVAGGKAGGKKSVKSFVGGEAHACCSVASILSVDDRGQMVLPKDVRERVGIKAGDRLALAYWEKGGKVCCLVLMKADELGPMMQSAISEDDDR